MKNGIKGFFRSFLLAVISFFVVFLIFPDSSEKYFGVSVRNNDYENFISGVKERIEEKTEETVREVEKRVIKNLIPGSGK